MMLEAMILACADERGKSCDAFKPVGLDSGVIDGVKGLNILDALSQGAEGRKVGMWA